MAAVPLQIPFWVNLAKQELMAYGNSNLVFAGWIRHCLSEKSSADDENEDDSSHQAGCYQARSAHPSFDVSSGTSRQGPIRHSCYHTGPSNLRLMSYITSLLPKIRRPDCCPLPWLKQSGQLAVAKTSFAPIAARTRTLRHRITSAEARWIRSLLRAASRQDQTEPTIIDGEAAA